MEAAASGKCFTPRVRRRKQCHKVWCQWWWRRRDGVRQPRGGAGAMPCSVRGHSRLKKMCIRLPWHGGPRGGEGAKDGAKEGRVQGRVRHHNNRIIITTVATHRCPPLPVRVRQPEPTTHNTPIRTSTSAQRTCDRNVQKRPPTAKNKGHQSIFSHARRNAPLIGRGCAWHARPTTSSAPGSPQP